jgi:hypothetical protein
MMPLLNEAVEVWRPVDATKLDNGAYRIEGPVPDEEEWAFDPGAIARWLSNDGKLSLNEDCAS